MLRILLNLLTLVPCSVLDSRAIQSRFFRPPDSTSLDSVYQTAILDRLNTSLHLLPETHVTFQTLKDSARKSQDIISGINMWKVKVASVLVASTPLQKASIAACQLPGSGAWLTRFPGFGFCLTNDTWRAAVRFRLTLPVYSNKEVQCPLCSTELLDVYGIHSVYCSGADGAIFRHNLVRDTIFAIARKAHVSVRKEEGHLLADADGLKPADLLFPAWDGGPPLCLDVSIANSLATLHAPRPFSPMEPLQMKHNDKIRKYEALCVARGVAFKPFVCGSLAGLTDDASLFLKQLGTALSCTTAMSRDTAIADVLCQVSFAIQKAQALSILTRGELASVLL